MPEHMPGRSGRAVERQVAVSVVIACFDGEATLGAQLDALVGQQGAPAFEVIVADNGSTDGSAALARSYADRLDIRVVDASQVRGPAHARNRGVAAAHGPHIAFCDADDVVAPDWVAAMHAALRVDGFVAGRVDVHRLNERARVTGVETSREMEQVQGLQASGTGVDLPHAGAGNMGVHKAVFDAVGGFDTSLRCLEDSDLCWRIQLAGTPLVFHPEVLIHTRLRHTWRAMATQAYGYGRSFAQLEARYGRRPDAPEQERELEVGPETAASRLARVNRLVRELCDGGAGHAVWHGAWHLGHLMGARAAGPASVEKPSLLRRTPGSGAPTRRAAGARAA